MPRDEHWRDEWGTITDDDIIDAASAALARGETVRFFVEETQQCFLVRIDPP